MPKNHQFLFLPDTELFLPAKEFGLKNQKHSIFVFARYRTA
jgi:hypothetical protein